MLCFQFDFDVSGLWIALALGATVQAVLYVRLIFYGVDWDQVANDSQKLLAGHEGVSSSAGVELQKALSH